MSSKFTSTHAAKCVSRISSLLLGLALISSTPAHAKTAAEMVVPFLCNTSDESAVSWVSKSNTKYVFVNLVGTADYGGAVISGIPSTSSASNSLLTVNAVSGTNTANLAVEAVVKGVNNGQTTILTVNPTSQVEKNKVTTVTFDFSKAGFAAGTTIADVAVEAYVKTTATAGGSVFMYDFSWNGTAITRGSVAPASCISLTQ